MRKLLTIFICCILLSCGEKEKKAKENYDKLKEISVGMPEKEVIKIMGTPKEKDVSPYTNKKYRFIYDAPFGMSDNIIIIFSVEDSLVVGVNDGT